MRICEICGKKYKRGYATICSDNCMANHIILKYPRNKIIHKTTKSKYGSPYLCNQVVVLREIRRSSYRWKHVTCKNCLKQRYKYYKNKHVPHEK